MSDDIIRRVVGVIDERLPLKEFMEVSRKQAEAMPLEITENGVVYEVFDIETKIKVWKNTAIGLYRKKAAVENSIAEKKDEREE